MNHTAPSSNDVKKSFASTSLAFATHLFGALTCAQLFRTRERHKELPYRMAVAFTGFSAIGWTASTVFIAATLVKG